MGRGIKQNVLNDIGLNNREELSMTFKLSIVLLPRDTKEWKRTTNNTLFLVEKAQYLEEIPKDNNDNNKKKRC